MGLVGICLRKQAFPRDEKRKSCINSKNGSPSFGTLQTSFAGGATSCRTPRSPIRSRVALCVHLARVPLLFDIALQRPHDLTVEAALVLLRETRQCRVERSSEA